MKRYYESTRIASLLVKFVMQNISESEKQELASLVKKSGIDVQEVIEKAVCQDIAPNDDADIEAGRKLWKSIERDIKRSDRRWGRMLLPYVAIFVGMIGLAAFYFMYPGQSADHARKEMSLLKNETVLEFPSGQKVVLTEGTNILDIIQQNAAAREVNPEPESAEIYKVKVLCGATQTVTLEDSTTVVLYPGSELQFPAFFSSRGRAVKLLGEGYFEVRRDSSRPFTVEAESVSIVVLGTSFNVRAYQGESTIETVLVTGKVMLNGTVLQPNEMAIFNRKDQHIRIEHVEADIYQQRAQGMFIFDNKTLDEIMREFSLWYGFKYSFEDSVLQNKKFRLKLPRADSFDKLMSLMEKTEEIQFSVSEQGIKIMDGKK